MCFTHTVGYIDNPDVYSVPCSEAAKNSEYDVEKARGEFKKKDFLPLIRCTVLCSGCTLHNLQ